MLLLLLLLLLLKCIEKRQRNPLKKGNKMTIEYI